MIEKIVRKSEVLHKHGKHKSVLMEVRALQHKPEHKSEMGSLDEILKRPAKKRKRRKN